MRVIVELEYEVFEPNKTRNIELRGLKKKFIENVTKPSSYSSTSVSFKFKRVNKIKNHKNLFKKLEEFYEHGTRSKTKCGE